LSFQLDNFVLQSRITFGGHLILPRGFAKAL
jgi:hypothetical protein